MSIQIKHKQYTDARSALLFILLTLLNEEIISKVTHDLLYSKITTMDSSHITIDDVIKELYEKGKELTEMDDNSALYGQKYKYLTLNKYLLKLYKL